MQRGHNRERCFFAEDDYGGLPALAKRCVERDRLPITRLRLDDQPCPFANHPQEGCCYSAIDDFPGRRYVQYSNTTYRHTGTLWDSRYKSSMIQAETYLLDCMRYIELNPVRAAMVDDPAQYCRSGYRANGLAVTDLACPPATNRTASSLYSSVYDARLLLSLVISWLLFQVIYTRLRSKSTFFRGKVVRYRTTEQGLQPSMPNRRASTSGRA